MHCYKTRKYEIQQKKTFKTESYDIIYKFKNYFVTGF